MRPTRLVFTAAGFLAAAGFLSACAGNYPGYPHRYAAEAPPPPPPAPAYRVVHGGDETDYVMLDRVLFALDSARIGPHAYEIVADAAADARDHPYARIEVDGYTDTSGTRDYNQALSEARADAVARLLIRHGVDGRRVRSRGFGESHLAVPTPDGVRLAENRRVVIRLIRG